MMTLLLLRTALISAFATLALTGCKKPVETPAPAAPAAAPQAAKPVVEPAKPATTSETPELKVALVDGSQYDLAAHRGKWVVVNFWATWCKPCLKEMPELSALDVMRDHIEVIGLAYEEIDAADMQAFLKKRPVAYPIAIVDTYNPPAAFETPRGLPMTYLIAPDGKIAKKILGPVTAKDIESAIAAAGGSTPEVASAAQAP